jgi:hypothetical protein
MRKLIVDNKWEYEIIKNEGEGIKGYGYACRIYKNDKEVSKEGAFGGVSMAQVYARDYFLMYEFNIERDID